ncbi:hypothetical protein [Saccharopolyspora spinosa]|uniref:Uncharacterized protein n=1 Tax=Saccharopolyspora spinosa TaxID=60894 RepID=A0A2N3Y8I7_SACSN|nr:hypothetical protein A8926_7367 [Saccharopolyspora spinosa]
MRGPTGSDQAIADRPLTAQPVWPGLTGTSCGTAQSRRLRLILGDQDFVLNAGEVVEFDTRLEARITFQEAAPPDC